MIGGYGDASGVAKQALRARLARGGVVHACMINNMNTTNKCSLVKGYCWHQGAGRITHRWPLGIRSDTSCGGVHIRMRGGTWLLILVQERRCKRTLSVRLPQGVGRRWVWSCDGVVGASIHLVVV